MAFSNTARALCCCCNDSGLIGASILVLLWVGFLVSAIVLRRSLLPFVCPLVVAAAIVSRNVNYRSDSDASREIGVYTPCIGRHLLQAPSQLCDNINKGGHERTSEQLLKLSAEILSFSVHFTTAAASLWVRWVAW